MQKGLIETLLFAREKNMLLYGKYSYFEKENIFMRTLMLFCVGTFFIVTLPITSLLIIGLVIRNAVHCIDERLGFDHFIDDLKAMLDGFKVVHTNVMRVIDELCKD